ncbi:MAG: type II toxin-antitoxin system HicA family toxin [Elusimicrobiota bacterium]|nr:MAG: type II toxin-antitoxin system HicA family toxin [Elusimicrobiota bacterium]
MGGLPVVSGREAVRALAKAGFTEVRRKGSHIILQKILPGTTNTLIVPDHKELANGTLRAIIRKSGLSVDEFSAFL